MSEMNNYCQLCSVSVQDHVSKSPFSTLEDMMRKIAITVSALALMGFAVPAMAHGSDNGWDNGWQSPHDQLHDQLDEQHNDIHDQLNYEHAQAHEEGLTPWEHAQLHRDLAWQHQNADRQIRREHRRAHRWSQWNSWYGY
jgi:hypothetical protein